MASDRRVSALALNIPYPFPPGAAAEWIATEQAGWAEGTGYTFSLREIGTGAFVGVAGFKVEPSTARAELGYTIAPSAWGNGYATEAGRELVRFGFEELQLNRLTANHLAANIASGRVLEKLGFRQEARLQSEASEGDGLIDLVFCGLLREEYYA